MSRFFEKNVALKSFIKLGDSTVSGVPFKILLLKAFKNWGNLVSGASSWKISGQGNVVMQGRILGYEIPSLSLSPSSILDLWREFIFRKRRRRRKKTGKIKQHLSLFKICRIFLPEKKVI